jgi:hypothetical protein
MARVSTVIEASPRFLHLLVMILHSDSKLITYRKKECTVKMYQGQNIKLTTTNKCRLTTKADPSYMTSFAVGTVLVLIKGGRSKC